jgi:hypothetical protein
MFKSKKRSFLELFYQIFKYLARPDPKSNYEDGAKINRVEFGGSIRQKDEIKMAPKKQIEINNDKKIKTVSKEKHNVAQTERLKSFLFLYCKSYESKDLDKFANFFYS